MSKAYYNEYVPEMAAWIRELIKEKLIPDGDVDTRSIVDVTTNDVKGYTQQHYFAGCAGWSIALRMAGWPDDRPVWTGSTPCQPWSTAGHNKGFKDERHLWPDFFRLIQAHKPSVLFCEQVSNKDSLAWLDVVLNNLEDEDYETIPISVPCCLVGAPHKRERLYIVADTFSQRREGRGLQLQSRESRIENLETSRRGAPSNVGNTNSARGRRNSGSVLSEEGESTGKWFKCRNITNCAEPEGSASELGNSDCAGLEERKDQSSNQGSKLSSARRACSPSFVERGISGSARTEHDSRSPGIPEAEPTAGPTNGEWRIADWLYCTDGRWRCTEPNVPVLASKFPNRAHFVRGYGNAIVPALASEVIKAYMELGRG
jgi:DNA (cytosine-5)-methyltransferase 1